jgi:hypothetical protein
MVGHRRAPGVEHGGEADAGSELLGIGGDGEPRLRCRAKQQVFCSWRPRRCCYGLRGRPPSLCRLLVA